MWRWDVSYCIFPWCQLGIGWEGGKSNVLIFDKKRKTEKEGVGGVSVTFSLSNASLTGLAERAVGGWRAGEEEEEDGVSAIVGQKAAELKNLISILPLSLLSGLLTVSNAFLGNFRGG